MQGFVRGFVPRRGASSFLHIFVPQVHIGVAYLNKDGSDQNATGHNGWLAPGSPLRQEVRGAILRSGGQVFIRVEKVYGVFIRFFFTVAFLIFTRLILIESTLYVEVLA